MPVTTSIDYRNIIDAFKAGRLSDKAIEQRLSDLLLLFDFSASMNRAAGMTELADLLLLTLMGYTASRRAVFLLKTGKGLEVVASRGYRKAALPSTLPCSLATPYPDSYSCDDGAPATEWKALCEALSIGLLMPVLLEGRLLGVVGLGERMSPRKFSTEQIQTLVSLVMISASGLQNAQTGEMMQSLNRQLILKVYQLNTLFELSKDFNAVWEQEAIYRVLGSSLIGQLLVSRCAVFTFLEASSVEPRFVRGFRFPEDYLQNLDFRSLFSEERKPLVCSGTPQSEFDRFCAANRVHLLFPLVHNEELRGVIFLGEKRNRKEFSQEDFDFIGTLTSLALVSDDNARMQREMIQKQRMERELSIARDIQHSLLPQVTPQIPGYEIASYFRPCYQVGGDYFDFIPVSGSELAVLIGDVSGKSTPAAMIMACLQSSIRTLASMKVSDPKVTIEHINNLLCQSQSSKYVTFFYAVLNHNLHEVAYVNAGHCYPLIFKADGEVDRLESGGTVLGFFRDVTYRGSSYRLDPGDLVFLYTDGVTESINESEEEFGVERIVALLKENRERSVDEIREAIVLALKEYTQKQDQSDDITFILLKRTE
jgi:sigma-B regulation protein RsbU (phosphoserine phosphatase)